jgi:predicted RNA binding protein YcfA (HicA-like mRNA interferase family)
MARLPLLSARELSKILQKLGFELKRQQGSHMFFEHPDGRTTIVPNHPSEEIDRGLLVKIIKQDLQIVTNVT